MKPVIVTGDRPTGPLHLGHYVGSIQNRLKLQKTHEQFILIADSQALTDKFATPRTVRDNVMEVALDYLAVGLDPHENVIFIQSLIPELFELSSYLLNLVSLSRLEKNPTIKEEIVARDFERSIPAGFLTYPVSQAADILAFRADLVPVGDDQKPLIDQTNEIAMKFNEVYKTNIFKTVTALIGRVGRLPGIDGYSKMGKSVDNAIYLCDSIDTIQRKINLMDLSVVIQFLNVFDHEREKLESLSEAQMRKRLMVILDCLIRPIRQRREELKTDMTYVLRSCLRGTDIARQRAANTLREVKSAMHMDYNAFNIYNFNQKSVG